MKATVKLNGLNVRRFIGRWMLETDPQWPDLVFGESMSRLIGRMADLKHYCSLCGTKAPHEGITMGASMICAECEETADLNRPWCPPLDEYGDVMRPMHVEIKDQAMPWIR